MYFMLNYEYVVSAMLYVNQIYRMRNVLVQRSIDNKELLSESGTLFHDGQNDILDKFMPLRNFLSKFQTCRNAGILRN